MRISLYSFLLTYVFLANSCQNQSPQIQSPMNSSEIALINETVAGVFGAICFEPGQPPNMPGIKNYFTESGMLVDYNQDEPLILPVDDFIKHFNSQWQMGNIPSLEDREVHQETKIYGRVAHRFSFYEARFDKNDPQPFAQGVNSIQLIKIAGEWRITSMAWNDDNRGDGFFKKIVGDSNK